MTQINHRKCKACGAELFFVRDSAGKVHPLDAKAPTFVIEKDMTGAEVAVRTQAYVTHFSTCPKASEFSASKRKASV